MEKKNLSDLIDAIQVLVPEARENTDLFVKAFFRTITKGLEKDKYVKIKGFGTFKVISVSPRESVDVSSGERIEIGGHSKITFTPDAEVREAVNSPFAHLQTVVINEGTDISQMDVTDNEKIDEIHRGIQKENGGEVPAREEAEEKPEEEPANIGEQQLDSKAAAEDNQEENTPEDTVNAEEDSSADDTEEEPVSEERGRGNKKIVVAMVVTAILCFAAGFFVAEYVVDIHPRKDSPSPVAAPTAKTNVAKTKTPQRQPLKKDTVAKARQQEAERLPVMPVQKGDDYAIVGTKTVHELKAGENITRLAKQVYGSKDLVKYIVRFNGIENPDLIPIGTKLKIPELQPLSQASGQ